MTQQPTPSTRHKVLAVDALWIREVASFKVFVVPSTIDSILIAHSRVVRFATISGLAVGMFLISLLGVYGNFSMGLQMSKEI